MRRFRPGVFLGLVLLAMQFLTAGCQQGIQSEPEPFWPGEEWEISPPDSLDRELVEEMFAEIDRSELRIDGVVVVQRGKIVIERYFPPYSENSLHEIYSITKSVISALIGIALKEGCLESLDDPVVDYFPGHAFKLDDEVTKSITIRQLLTMSSGLEYNRQAMLVSSDWVKTTLEQPQIHPPGEVWFYSNGGPQILSSLINQACGENTYDFAERLLFEPLGIQEYTWQRLNPEYPNGSWGMRIKPRDLARIGHLYVNDGIWDGQRILPEGWVEASWQPYFQVPEPLEPWGLAYGYLWWIHEDGIYAAHGFRGQFLMVAPEQDLVAVITGNLADEDFVQPQLLFRDYIIPALGGGSY